LAVTDKIKSGLWAIAFKPFDKEQLKHYFIELRHRESSNDEIHKNFSLEFVNIDVGLPVMLCEEDDENGIVKIKI